MTQKRNMIFLCVIIISILIVSSICLIYFQCKVELYYEPQSSTLNNAKINQKYSSFAHDSTIWKEYKCIRPTHSSSKPYNNCYIIITNSHLFYYYRDGQLILQDSLLRDESYSFPVYRLSHKQDDIIQFLTNSGDSIILIRDNFDGEKEYLQKCTTGTVLL